MGSHDFSGDVVAPGKYSQFPVDFPGGQGLAGFIDENQARLMVLLSQPGQHFLLQITGEINSPGFGTLGADIHIRIPDMFSFYLNQFAHPYSRTGHYAHQKVPEPVFLRLQLFLEFVIVFPGDYGIHEGLGLTFDDLQTGSFLLAVPARLGFFQIIQIAVDGADARIDGGGAKTFQ